MAAPTLAAGAGPVGPGSAIASSPPVSAADWTGAYGGLTFGAAVGRSDAELGEYHGDLIEKDVEHLGLFPHDIDETDSSPIGGVTLGYNLQRGSFVGGVELDISVLDHDVEAEFSRFDPIFMTDTDTGYRTEISGLATLRLRAGLARDRNLFFGTAGLAVGSVENTFSLDLPGFPYSNSWSEDATRYGYVVGAGVERRLRPGLSLKGEVMYYDLEDVTVKARDNDFFPGQGLDYEFKNDGFLARIGLNLAF